MGGDLKEGAIIWNGSRPDIRYSDGSYHGGLHCGDMIESLIQNEWRTTRIEYCQSSGMWYLVDLERYCLIVDILWLTVRK